MKIGLMPLNIIHINAGMTLSSLEKVGVSFTVIAFYHYFILSSLSLICDFFLQKNILWIAVLGILALIPTMFKKKIEKFDSKSD
jgi:hypothetical protein